MTTRLATLVLVTLCAGAGAQEVAPIGSGGPPRMRGVTLPLHSDKPEFDYGPLLRELPELGVSHVCVMVKIFQTNGRSASPSRLLQYTPSDLTVLRTLAQARRLGLEVVLMPFLLLQHPAEDEWRGNLQPPDWGEWFRGYQRELKHFARLAEQAQAKVLVVGSELSSTEGHARRDGRLDPEAACADDCTPCELREHWLETIAQARRIFSGQLTYAANWDHYQAIPFWTKLDYVGLSAYYELAKDPDPTLESVLASWRRVRGELVAWRAQRELEQPFLILEVGYTSQDRTLSHPWKYTLNTAVDLQEQALGYEAFARCWRGQPALAGSFFYEWWGEGGPEDNGYTPRGKPALDVLRRFYRLPR